MSSGLHDLIDEIEQSVGLDEDDTREDLSLDIQYACLCGADAIRILKTRIARLEMAAGIDAK